MVLIVLLDCFIFDDFFVIVYIDEWLMCLFELDVEVVVVCDDIW